MTALRTRAAAHRATGPFRLVVALAAATVAVTAAVSSSAAVAAPGATSTGPGPDAATGAASPVVAPRLLDGRLTDGLSTDVVGAAQQAPDATVTLVTGDRLRVHTGPDGRRSAVVVSAERDPGGYLTHQVGDDLYVVPASAAPLLAQDRLDERLFNVTALVDQGYDDAHSEGIPLIALYGNARASAPTPAGSRRTRMLPSIGAAALVADKDRAGTFWQELANPRSRSATAIRKLWLDAKVQPSLDRSVRQIGATQAWAEGYDGSGTTVAVLDSGYDPDHPDLKGRVTTAVNFTDRPNVVDEDGHGTHVASTVGGSGAASGGSRTGVAPGAELIVGRVLGPAGGQESWIVAGMEWAVDQGADVVNMSLGSRDPADCTDPVAEATKRLTAATQATTLFVIAAGNTGVREGVTSPGCAPGALTVAAVDRENRTAPFSARGPVVGTHTVKPDLSAPGVGIMAAALGSRGDNHYVAYSGTSMAAPHIAGAAAILAQRRPELTAQQRRTLLVSAAAPGATDGIYRQGAGVVDVPRALRQTVLGPGPVSLASFTWPHATAKPVTKAVAYENIGERAVTFDLALDVDGQDGSPAPRGMVRLGSPKLTVPAHGSATVSVTVDPRVRVDPAAYGEFGGRLVARAGDGTVVTTPVGFWLEPKTVDLTVRMLDRQGTPAASGFLDVVSLDSPSGQRVYADGEDDTFRVRAGAYSLASMMTTRDPGTTLESGGLMQSVTYAGRAELSVDRDMTVVLDARKGRRITVDADRPLESRGGALLYGRWSEEWVASGGYMANATLEDYYAVPDHSRVRTGHFELGTYLRMYAPALRMRVAGAQGPAIRPTAMDWGEALDGATTAEVVDVGEGTPDDLAAAAVRGRVALIHIADPRADSARIRSLLRDAATAGARAVLVGRDAPGRWVWTVRPTFVDGARVREVPGLTLTPEDEHALRTRLATGPVRLTWTAVADSPYVYNLAFFDKDEVAGDRAHTVRAKDLGRVRETWYAPRERALGYADLPTAARPWAGDALAYVGNTNQVRTPLRRDVYYTAGDTGWRQITSANTVWGAMVYDRVRQFRPGERDATTWFKHPMQTGIRQDEFGTPLHVAERQGNLVGFEFPHWQDAEPDHLGPRAGFGDVGGLELYYEGELIGSSEWGAYGQAQVPEAAGAYKVVVSTERLFAGTTSYPDWRLSLRTETAFTFRSGRPAGEETVALPFLLPDYDVDVDAYNLTPAVAGFPVRVTFAGQADYDPGAVGAVRAWASYDDGATWVAAPVSPSGDAWVARVDNRPASGGYVTLKVAGTDSLGNGVEQVVERAYGVR